MFCSKCGAQNAEGSLFCNKCGAELTDPLSNDALKVQIEEARHLEVQGGTGYKLSLVALVLAIVLAVFIPDYRALFIILAVIAIIVGIWSVTLMSKYARKRADLIKKLK